MPWGSVGLPDAGSRPPRLQEQPGYGQPQGAAGRGGPGHTCASESLMSSRVGESRHPPCRYRLLRLKPSRPVQYRRCQACCVSRGGRWGLSWGRAGSSRAAHAPPALRSPQKGLPKPAPSKQPPKRPPEHPPPSMLPRGSSAPCPPRVPLPPPEDPPPKNPPEVP